MFNFFGCCMLWVLIYSRHVVKVLDDLAKKGKGSPYSITERRVPEPIAVLGSQPAGDVNHKSDGKPDGK